MSRLQKMVYIPVEIPRKIFERVAAELRQDYGVTDAADVIARFLTTFLVATWRDDPGAWAEVVIFPDRAKASDAASRIFHSYRNDDQPLFLAYRQRGRIRRERFENPHRNIAQP